jgi:glycosyltransferase involved in cell wall biosynthesis
MVTKEFGIVSLTRATRTVCWRLSGWNPDIASVRNRAAIPALHLADRGVASRFSSGPHSVLEPSPPDAVVFVKAFGERDVEQAREAARAGVPVLLDACDNIFAPGYVAHSPENLRRMAKVAAGIVTTGPALAKVLRGELDCDLPLHVVPDPVETPEDVRDAARILRRQRLRRGFQERPSDIPRALGSALRREILPTLRRRIPRARIADIPQVLWFGNVGSVEPRFGIVNLTDIAGELEAAAREVPFRLLVVTGDRDAYRERVEPIALDTAFTPWDRLTIFRHVRNSAVVIVPNSRDEFSLCKSANRTTLALFQGVPVVATRIPSLDALADCILFDDFHGGLVTYFRDGELAAEHVRRARLVIGREFAGAAVAEQWLRSLDAAIPHQIQ